MLAVVATVYFKQFSLRLAYEWNGCSHVERSTLASFSFFLSSLWSSSSWPRVGVSLTPDAVLLHSPSPSGSGLSLHTMFPSSFSPPTFTLTSTTSRQPKGEEGLKNILYYRWKQGKWGFFIPLGKEGKEGWHMEGCWRDERRRGLERGRVQASWRKRRRRSSQVLPTHRKRLRTSKCK